MFARWWDSTLCLTFSNAPWPSFDYLQTSVTTVPCHRYTGYVLYVQDFTAVHIVYALYLKISELTTSP